MVERGIYDLSTWVSGMQYLPSPKEIAECFVRLGFEDIPSEDELKTRYKKMCRIFHPDEGGSTGEFAELKRNYELCVQKLKGENYERD